MTNVGRGLGILIGLTALGAGVGLASYAFGGAPADECPAALRAAWIRSTQRDASPQYFFDGSDSAARVSVGTGRYTVAQDGLGLSEADAAWSAQLGTARVGRSGRLVDISRSAPIVSTNEARFEGAGMTELWVSGPLGLEQVIEIERRPAGAGELVVELPVGGDLTPALASDGLSIELRDETGAVRARYGDLFVADAAHHAIPAHLEVAAATLRLRVDDRDAEYPLSIDPLVGVEQDHFRGSTTAAGDWFGYALDMDGDTAVIGAPFHDTVAGADAGTAYVFVRTGTTWAEQARLVAADGVLADQFGNAVAINGNTIVVGAPFDDTFAGANAGSVYVFTRVGSTWTAQAQLFPGSPVANDRFGGAIAIEGDTLIIGAARRAPGGISNAGQAFVFSRTGSSWTEQAQLTASDAGVNDLFGWAVAISGNTVVVSAFGDTRPAGANVGSAYVFLRAGSTWTEQQHLFASDGAALDAFGGAVAIDRDTIVVGAGNHDTGGLTDAGQAYIYTRSGTTWTQQAILAGMGAIAGDRVGAQVSIDTDTVLASATSASVGAGSAFIFQRSGTTWSQTGRIVPADGVFGDSFGGALSLVGDFVLVGAYRDDTTAGLDSGSVYAMLIRSANGDTCTSGASCASGFCSDGVCCNTACGSGAADCQACSVASGAVVDGTCGAYVAGTVCRADLGLCDSEEVCDGVAGTCPADVVEVAGVSCRPSLGDCDPAEVCTGSSGACPGDTRTPSGTECRAGVGICDPAETCDGSPSCPADALSPDGTSCSNGVACDGAETCSGGACTIGAAPTCDDSNVCTADACAEPGGCMNVAIVGCCNTDSDCDDLDDCTGDMCSGAGGTCSHVPLTVCVDGGPREDAAVVIPDAGPRDAGPDAGRDGSVADGGARDGGDAGDAGDPGTAAGGCGCAAVGTRNLGSSAAPLGLLGLALLVARRRRRR